MNRLYQIDFLRALAIIFVIFIHSFTIFSYLGTEIFMSGYLGSIFRPCIAIFIFISGYLLKDRLNTWDQLSKRFKRVLIPYLFFSFFAIIYSIIKQVIGGKKIVISKYLIDLFLGNTIIIYYFVFVILVIYSLYFLILKAKISYKIFLLLTGIILIVYNISFNDSMFPEYLRYRYIFWPFYFFLGIYFKEKEILKYLAKQKIKNYIIITWLATLAFLTFIYVYKIEDTNGYNSLTISLYSIATILLLLAVSFKNKIINFLSKISYFIFLSHFFAIALIFDLNNYIFHSKSYWILSLVSLFFTLTLPLLIYYIQKKLFKNKIAFLLGI